MLLRDRVVEWLNNQDDVTDVHPVQVNLHSLKWQGAVFVRAREKIFYLIGERPKHNDPTCYRLQSYNYDPTDIGRLDWYIGGYAEGSVDREIHPFGKHWILVPWIIEDDPESQIDDYADEPYKRATLTIEEF